MISLPEKGKGPEKEILFSFFSGWPPKSLQSPRKKGETLSGPKVASCFLYLYFSHHPLSCDAAWSRSTFCFSFFWPKQLKLWRNDFYANFITVSRRWLLKPPRLLGEVYSLLTFRLVVRRRNKCLNKPAAFQFRQSLSWPNGWQPRRPTLFADELGEQAPGATTTRVRVSVTFFITISIWCL